MFIEIITPEEKVFEGEIRSATLPGSEGGFQILNDHAPIVSTLGLGYIELAIAKAKGELKDKEVHFKIDGGVVEVKNNNIIVLAEAILTD